MRSTLDARRTVLAATLTSLIAVWGCGRDTIAGPGPESSASGPSLDAAPAAPSPPPPTLTGEILTSTAATTYRQSGNCQTDNTVTLSYAVRGAATTPYLGTFTEAGRWRVTFAGQPGQPRVPTSASFNAAFAIFSPTGFVVGTKSLSPVTDPYSLTPIFVCGAGGDVNPDSFVGAYAPSVTYSALIRTAGGSFRDSGDASLTFARTAPGTPFTFTVTEFFKSTQSVTTPIGEGEDP